MTKLLYPHPDEEIILQTDIQMAFFRSCAEKEKKNWQNVQFDWQNLVRSGKRDYTFPPSAVFQWTTDSPTSVFYLETETGEDIRIAETQENEITVNNLRAGEKYIWYVNDSEKRFLRTADLAPRWIGIDSLGNIRDTGVWRTKEGKRLKQGLIYRGCEMDIHYTVTPKGIEQLLGELQIRTDLDLRGEAKDRSCSPISPETLYYRVPVSAYDKFIREDNRETARKIFTLLADETLYPIYYHCWGGADRTGTIAYILGAFLGVPERELLVDYELTSLGIWGKRDRGSDLFVGFLTAFDSFEGTNPQEKATSFLRLCGVTESDLQRLKENLIEP